MNKLLKYIVPAAAMMLSTGFSSCTDDLHVTPIDPSLNTDPKPEQLLNKCYANFGLPGNGGASGDSDIDGIDGGTSGLYRQYWNSNELPTDEAICAWGDDGISSFCYDTYDASNPMLQGYYYRLAVGIAYCNQYINQFGSYNTTMTAEARFLRAFQYYLMMDAYGNIPFSTTVSSEKPVQYSRQQVYSFIESELLDICGDGDDSTDLLAEPAAKTSASADWGKVDKAAAWMLLSRLYLNAEVYTGTAQWEKAATYAKKVIDSPYKLNTTGSSHEVNGQTWQFSAYQMLFMGDNDKTSAAQECIMPIIADGQRTTSWGTSLFLMAGTYDGDMHGLRYDEGSSSRSVNGVTSQAWGGNRARPQLIRLFFPGATEETVSGIESYDMPAAAEDDRAIFNSVGRTLNVTDRSIFKQGYAVAKFNNFTTDGSSTRDASFPDMDVFMLRVAEAYLNYAEAEERLGNQTEAATYINALRSRAHASTKPGYSLNDILDEWGREFYFEGMRRTTLIRFGKFGGNTDYQWQWKGGVYDGRNFESYRNIFAIPTSDLTANENLHQNTGYGE